MKLSAEKAKETKALFQQDLADFNQELTPAVLAYIGEAFKALNAEALTQIEIKYLHQNLFILSGYYGILKASDGIVPYRLEMQQKMSISKQHKSLYAFWRPLVENYLNVNLLEDEPILNLASDEYSDLIQVPELTARMIQPVFCQQKEEQLQRISVFSKQARGLMAKWCAENQLTDIKNIQTFNLEGYQFSKAHSTEQVYFFIRKTI
jgi:cytoplasmic iron level regulating protein YaaA (DUF328/UPF0246 family)